MEFFCSNCGASLRANLQSSKLVDCEYCETTQFIEDEGVRSLGKRGVLLTPPALIEVGRPFSVQGNSYMPIGMIRYDYGQGTWDEFYCVENGETCWISVDEGDIAIERALDPKNITNHFKNPKAPPKSFEFNEQTFGLMEHDVAKCVAVRGELPEAVEIGLAHHFYDYGSPQGQIITYEQWYDGVAFYYGSWCDPFEINLGQR